MENKSILAQLLADQPERTAPGSYLDPAMWGRLNLDSPVTHGLAGALRGLYGVVDFPRQYMQGGIDREAATDWAAPMALNMVGAPGGGAGLGSGVRLYHGTTRQNAEALRGSELRAPAYLTPRKDVASQYGEAVLEFDVPKSQLLIDADLPGGRLLTLKEANAYFDRPGWTIDDYLAQGASVGSLESIKSPAR